MRAAVVDIGSNSTRLLIADVDRDAGAVTEIRRRSEVTRLGGGLEATGALSPDGIERVLRTLSSFRDDIRSHGARTNLALLTEAVRRSSNGERFAQRVRDDFGLDARVLTGEQEALLTFLGATYALPGADDSASPAPTVVVDIGGASTEFVIGTARAPGFHVSLPLGVVRMSERHIRRDPPAGAEVASLAEDARAIFLQRLPRTERAAVRQGIAVAGTATSAAAMDQKLERYDPARVHGYELSCAAVVALLERTAAMNEVDRRHVPGLHPDRAPTIVAGLAILREAMRAFELQRVTVSEHDILFGGMLRLAGLG